MMKPVRPYYGYLDVFRGAAVIWVYLHHINIFFDLKNILHPVFYGLLRPLCLSGYLGVDIFFVISGFLITGLLTEDLDRGIGIRRFYIRRFFKIIPSYLAVVVPAIGLSTLLPCDFLEFYGFSCPAYQNWPAHLLFLQNYTHEINPTLGHTWTLCIEEHFYLFYALILLIIWKSFAAPAARIRAAVWTAVFIIAGSNLLRFINFNLNHPFLVTRSDAFQSTLLHCDGLMIGCLIKIFEKTIIKNLKSPVVIRGLVLSGFLVYALFLIPHYYHRDQIWYYFLLAALAPAGLIIACLCGFNQWARGHIIKSIGKNSYGIYLWHYPLIMPFIFIPDIPGWLRVGLYTSTALAAGFLSTKFIERPFLNTRNNVCP